MSDLIHRSEFLYEVITKYAKKSDSILEIGDGDGRNVEYLKDKGYKVTGIDKLKGTAIETIATKKYDIVFTMSTLFLIEDESVFAKIASMAKKFIITIEGEAKVYDELYYHDYQTLFEDLGFKQVEHQENVFNHFGHLRVFKK